jgi:hypothetical protein
LEQPEQPMAARKNERSRWRRLAPALVVGLCAFAGTAQAQFFGDRFYNDNYGGGYGGDRYQRYQRPREDFNFPFGDRFIRPAPPPADYSKAPPPRKLDNPPTTNVVVIGDSLADWLAYGLDETYTDQPDTGVVRKIKPTAGLVRYDAKNENLDWAQALKDTLAGEKPNAIVVMLGLNDRVPLKDRVVPKPAPAPAQAPGGTGQGAAGQSPAQGSTQTQGQGPAPAQGQAQGSGQEKGQAQSREQGQAEPAKPAQAAAQPSQAAQLAKADGEGGAPPASADPVATGATFEFHTDKWAELYGRRVDEMINVLKARGVPILWVGAPALRGTKSTSDMAYLDEIYRERAEKAGIAYVDIWDGFVDEQGRYTVQGPDFEGQTRKLRTPDGVHFTKAGAVKLASYVDQELRRVMSKGVITPVALPAPDAAAPAKPAAAVGTHPDVGPVVPLAIGGGDGGDLLGNGKPAQITSTDPVAAKVLTRGDAIAAPSGRADDFSWPRRGSNANAASGADAGPLPGPDQPAPSQAAPAAAPKKGADGKAGDTKASDGKASDAKSKAASDQSTPRPRRTPSATLDGAGVPRPPRDVGGGF